MSGPLIWKGTSAKILPTAGLQDYLGNAILPAQAGNGGKFLTTTGTVASWGTSSATTDPTGTALSMPTIMFDDFGHSTNAAPSGPFAWERYASGGSAAHASVAPLSSETNRYGIHQITPSTTAGIAGGVYSNSNLQVYPGGMGLSFAWANQVGKVADATDDWLYFGGFSSFVGIFTFGTDGIFFFFDRSLSANWQAVTRKTSTNNVTDTGIAVTTGWTNFRIEINSNWTSVGYYINGSLVATKATNIPSATVVSPQLYQYRVGTGTAVTTNTKYDWAYLAYTPSSARGTF